MSRPRIRIVPAALMPPPRMKALLVSLVLAFAFIRPVAAAGTGTLTISPSAGPPGTVIQVSGSPCPPPAGSYYPQARVGLVDEKGNTLASTQTPLGTDGSWRVSISVPAAAKPGVAAVQAQCVDQYKGAYETYPAAQFNVTGTQASPSPSPSPAPATTQRTTATTPPGGTTTRTQPTPTPTPSQSTTTTTTEHVHTNPIKSPWPKLDADDIKAVKDLIDAGKKKDALDALVKAMKKKCCNFGDAEGGSPVYDPDVKDQGEGVTLPNDAGDKKPTVKIFDPAFGSVALLYTTVKHELVHVQQYTDNGQKFNPGQDAADADERQAYQRELDNAEPDNNTGVSDAEKQTIKDRLGQH